MGSTNQEICGATTMVFVAALVAAFLSILVLSSCGNDPSSANLSPDSSVAQAAVFNCFCTELKAERQDEVEHGQAVTTIWPMLFDSVQSCIETQLNMDKDSANSAWLDVRENGRLSGISNGVTACSAGGYDVAAATTEP